MTLADVIDRASRSQLAEERVLFQGDLDDADIPELLFSLMDYLGVDALTSNGTIRVAKRELG